MKFGKFVLVTGIVFSAVAHAVPAPKLKVDPTYLPYQKRGILAMLRSGQMIHIKCMGSGSPTVILTAGMGDWAATWHKVQPEIAKKTRVCAWDRPGFGFSSGTAEPQTVVSTTAALEEALKVGHISGPYIAVGHSLGGYETLLFKDHNPRAVVGMVLLDPSIPDQHRRLSKVVPAFAAVADQFTANNLASLSRCLAGLKSGKFKPGAPDPDGCFGYAADYPQRLTAELDTLDTNPLRFTAAQSLLTNFDRDGEQVIDSHRNYGNMPLIVLSATKSPDVPGMSKTAKEQLPAFQAEWVRGHDEIAALSSCGVNRLVPDSTHYVQYDQPKAVVDAVNEVVDAARSNSCPLSALKLSPRRRHQP